MTTFLGNLDIATTPSSIYERAGQFRRTKQPGYRYRCHSAFENLTLFRNLANWETPDKKPNADELRRRPWIITCRVQVTSVTTMSVRTRYYTKTKQFAVERFHAVTWSGYLKPSGLVDDIAQWLALSEPSAIVE